MATDPVVDHLEKAFGDAYRKEVEQEENVWRSLPFFAATLALQLAVVAPLRDWVAGAEGFFFDLAAALLATAATATLAALVFLAQSIAPAEFRYVSRELELLEYAERVRAEAAGRPGATPEAADRTALAALRALLVGQYAAAAVHNREINQRRATRRTRAGIATLLSVLLTIALLAVSVITTSQRDRPVLRGGVAPHAQIA